MSHNTTRARPYAKAIFEYALHENQLASCSTGLLHLAYAVMIPEVEQFIANPATVVEQHIELLQAIISESDANKSLNNFITLLASNKRVMLLPNISALYEAYRAEQEKTLQVDVMSYSDLSQAQQQQLIESLSQRLARKVSLKISIDPSLLGGAVIRAGDLVIDGSVRGKLNKLSTELAA